MPRKDLLAGYTPRIALLTGTLVLVSAGVYVFGSVHEPDYVMGLLGSDYVQAVRLKAWLTTVVLVLAIDQLVLALWMYGRLPGVGQAPGWVSVVHRGGGYLLLATSLPIAVHCLLAYGTQTMTSRVAVHSLAGCFFYGAFAAKVLCVRSKRLPGWCLPLLGGSLVTLVALLWYSAAFWVFNDYQVPLLE